VRTKDVLSCRQTFPELLERKRGFSEPRGFDPGFSFLLFFLFAKEFQNKKKSQRGHYSTTANNQLPPSPQQRQ